MRQRFLVPALGFSALLPAFVFVACTKTDAGGDGGDGSPQAGSGGSSTGGTAGASTGGASGTGTSGAGAGGMVSTGGTGGALVGGAGGLGGGAGGAGGGGPVRPVGDISWDGTGWIAGAMNTFGVQGSWFSYNDCGDAMKQVPPVSCTMPDPLLIGPDGKAGWTTSPTEVCMKGTATQVIPAPDGGVPEGGVDYFGVQWGAGMAFDLNNAGSGATAMPYNAQAAGITGFIFDLIGTAPMTVRINFVMPTTESTAHFVQVTPALDTEVDFLNVNQGSWVTAPVAFDPTMLRTIQFQVFTNDMTATPYDFCVSNIRVVHAAM